MLLNTRNVFYINRYYVWRETILYDLFFILFFIIFNDLVEAPFFVKLLEDRAVQDNDLLQMKIRVNGIPNPSVAW